MSSRLAFLSKFTFKCVCKDEKGLCKKFLLVVLIPGFDSCDNVIMSRISEGHKKPQHPRRREREESRDMGVEWRVLPPLVLALDKNPHKTFRL